MSSTPKPTDPAATGQDRPTAVPADAEKGSDDGLFASIGKAIAAPVMGAAEPEEPPAQPTRPPVAPG